MKTTMQFLEGLHKTIGAVAGEICIALTIFKIPGGIRALERWAENLRTAADEIEEYVEQLKQRQNAIGR